MWQAVHTIVTIAAFVLTAGATLVGVTWRLSRAISELKDAIAAAREDIEQKQSQTVREFGETVAAVRQKIHEVETWARDTFVRRDSFLAVVTEVKQDISSLGERLEKRLERMEVKIDSKT